MAYPHDLGGNPLQVKVLFHKQSLVDEIVASDKWKTKKNQKSLLLNALMSPLNVHVLILKTECVFVIWL